MIENKKVLTDKEIADLYLQADQGKRSEALQLGQMLQEQGVKAVYIVQGEEPVIQRD